MYSSRVKQIISNPYVKRPSDHYNGVCCQDLRVPCKTNPEKISIYKINFFIYVENNTVKDTRVEVFGDPVFTACGYLVGRKLLDLSVEDARKALDASILSYELDTPLTGEQGKGIVIISEAALVALNNALYSTTA